MGYKRQRKAAGSRYKRPFKLSTLNKEFTILSRAFPLAVEVELVRQSPIRQAEYSDMEAVSRRRGPSADTKKPGTGD